jgi:hypothetical protein
LILKEVKVVDFYTLLQVLILKGLTGVAWPACFSTSLRRKKRRVGFHRPLSAK